MLFVTAGTSKSFGTTRLSSSWCFHRATFRVTIINSIVTCIFECAWSVWHADLTKVVRRYWKSIIGRTTGRSSPQPVEAIVDRPVYTPHLNYTQTHCAHPSDHHLYFLIMFIMLCTALPPLLTYGYRYHNLQYYCSVQRRLRSMVLYYHGYPYQLTLFYTIRTLQ